MRDEIDQQAMKTIFVKALRNFSPSTIEKAVDETLIRCQYPDLTQLYVFAEQFSKAGRYDLPQLTHHEEIKRTPMPDKLKNYIKNLKGRR